MWKSRDSRFIKGGIVGYIQKVVIMVLVILTAAFILSLFLNANFKTVLDFSIIVVLVIGALSVLGGSATTGNHGYNLAKSKTDMTKLIKQDVELRHESYSFCIFMGISAGVLYIIYLLI